MDHLRPQVTVAGAAPLPRRARPRILIVAFQFDNLNPTVRLWPLLFVGFADVTFFGPGFVPAATMREGLAVFLRRTGPFDVIVIDDHVIANSLSDTNRSANAQVYSRSYVTRFAPAEAIAAAPGLLADVVASGLPVIASQLEFDCYPMRQSHYDLLRASRFYIMGWGTELYPWLHELDTAGEGSWVARANDRWKTLVDAEADRVISTAAMIDVDESSFVPLAERRHEWSVPGTRYRSRAVARTALRAGGKRLGGGRHYLAMKMLSGLKLPLYSNRALLDLYNGGFRRTLQDSQFVYTCGSAVRLAIRKFFEIPAAGALLVCDPCYGFEALGFRDGENAVVCAPQALAAKFGSAPDLAAAQEIATAGQRLVLRTHSIPARAAQMKRCVDAIVAGSFNGAAWRAGSFELRDGRARPSGGASVSATPLSA